MKTIAQKGVQRTPCGIRTIHRPICLKTMKYFLFSILTFLLCSCSNLKKVASEKNNLQRLCGNYLNARGVIFGSIDVGAVMNMKVDSTFQYRWWMGLRRGLTKGKWKLIGDTIVLNSFKDTFDPPAGRLHYLDSSLHDTFRIEFIGDDWEALLEGVLCILADDSSTISMHHSDTSGLAQIPNKMNSERIKFIAHGYVPIILDIDSLKSNSFRLQMKWIDPDFRYFMEEKWLIRKNKLLMPIEPKDRYHKSQEFHIFKKTDERE